MPSAPLPLRHLSFLFVLPCTTVSPGTLPHSKPPRTSWQLCDLELQSLWGYSNFCGPLPSAPHPWGWEEGERFSRFLRDLLALPSPRLYKHLSPLKPVPLARVPTSSYVFCLLPASQWESLSGRALELGIESSVFSASSFSLWTSVSLWTTQPTPSRPPASRFLIAEERRFCYSLPVAALAVVLTGN